MIEVTNLRKNFGAKRAVNDVSFEAPKGQVLGFLGPNGAGKSTTMRMITGFLPPTRGSVNVCGVDMLREPVRAKHHIGYLPENAPLYTDMTVGGFLGFAADLRGFSGKAKREAVGRAVELCFLQSVQSQSIDTLSKGYKHRVCLAQALLHDPDVLILDEPTDGLDPNQKHEVRQLIKRLGSDKIVIFSTHILEEVEAVCSRAIIINRGAIIADGAPDDLRAKAPGAGWVRVALTGLAGTGLKQELQRVPGVKNVTEVVESEDGIRAVLAPISTGKSAEVLAAVESLARERNWKIQELSIAQGRLDDMFRSLTGSDQKFA